MRALEDILYPVVDIMATQHSGLKKDAKTVLFGMDAALDSIALMTFIAAVEQQTQAVSGKTVQIVTPEALAMDESPFATLGSLAAYLDQRLTNSVA
jgi:acyl carrier protein